MARGCPAVVGCNLAGERVGPAGEGSDHGPGAWLAGRTGKFCKQLGRFCKRTGRFCGQSGWGSGRSGSDSCSRGSVSCSSGCFSCFSLFLPERRNGFPPRTRRNGKAEPREGKAASECLFRDQVSQLLSFSCPFACFAGATSGFGFSGIGDEGHGGVHPEAVGSGCRAATTPPAFSGRNRPAGASLRR